VIGYSVHQKSWRVASARIVRMAGSNDRSSRLERKVSTKHCASSALDVAISSTGMTTTISTMTAMTTRVAAGRTTIRRAIVATTVVGDRRIRSLIAIVSAQVAAILTSATIVSTTRVAPIRTAWRTRTSVVRMVGAHHRDMRSMLRSSQGDQMTTVYVYVSHHELHESGKNIPAMFNYGLLEANIDLGNSFAHEKKHKMISILIRSNLRS
jgi:hypothetical protein